MSEPVTPPASETLAGLTKKTTELSDLLVGLNTSVKKLPEQLSQIFFAAGGDKKAFDNFFKNAEKLQKQELLRQTLDKKLDKNLDKMLKFLEVMKEDSQYNREQNEINAKTRQAQQKHQSGKEAAGAIFDDMIKDNPFLRFLSAKYTQRGDPTLPGSKRERYEAGKEGINYAGQVASDESFRKFVGRQISDEPISLALGGGSASSVSRRHPGGSVRRGGGVTSRGGISREEVGDPGILSELKKYGEGRPDTDAASFARVPYALSGGFILLHEDFMQMKEDFFDLEKKGGKEGKGALGNLAPFLATLAPLLPALGTILSTLVPILAGAAVLALLIASFQTQARENAQKRDAILDTMFDDKGNLLPEYKDKFPGKINRKEIYSAEDAQRLQDVGKGKVPVIIPQTAPLGANPSERNLVEAEMRAREQAIKGFDPMVVEGLRGKDEKGYFVISNGKKISYTATPEQKADLFQRFLSHNQGVPLTNYYQTPPESFDQLFVNSIISNKKKEVEGLLSFHGGGVAPRDGPVNVLEGERILSPYESKTYKRDIETIASRAAQAKEGIQNPNANLEKKIQELIDLNKTIVKLNETNNTLLNKEKPEPPKEQRSAPLAQTKIRDIG